MASGQNDTQPTTFPLVLRQPQAINQSVVKRTRAQEHQLPRKSAHLEASYQDKPVLVGSHDSNSGARRETNTQQQQKPPSRKRPRIHNDLAFSEEPSDERRERRREPAEENTLTPTSRGSLSEDDEHPIAHWAANKWWPRKYFEKGKDMKNILFRKRPISTRSWEDSDTGSATPSSIYQGEPKSRVEKSAEYKDPQYETLLATKGILMKASSEGVNSSSREWCKNLLESEQEFPQVTSFQDDLFNATCNAIRNQNETRVIRDIGLLIVPSAEIFAIRGATHLECLIDSVNEGWDNCIPITKTPPQPDYAVGFRREAFKQEQLDRMHPIIGDFNDVSYFMATFYMYFPFLTSEVKCGDGALDIADRQNAHSAAFAVRAVVELFRAVKREKELHQEILAFSISHDDRSVRIYGYYAEIAADSGTKYYRNPIRAFGFTELEGKEKWSAYKFTKNVYENWMPMHFKRICSAIDQIPTDINFSVTETPYPEQSSSLSQDFSAQSIAQSSSTGSMSA